MPSQNSATNHRSRSRHRPSLARKITKPNLLEIEAEPPPPKVETPENCNEKEPQIDSRVAAIFDRVFAGIFRDIPKPLSKLVRVFTSSTFTDTTIERNALMEEVYPRLKEYCRETHGLDFQVVDMRWGVRDEATDDHMTTQLCINEIANCQRLSVGANFVVFLCQKYGYRPIPSQIMSTEMELLKKTLREDHEDTALLETWYIEDSNSVPPMHVLQPISSILVNFNNKRMPKLQEQDTGLWWEAEERMQQLLRRAARTCYEKGLLDADSMHNYFMSVTEREVIHGILKAKNPNEHCLCYVRHINNIALNQTKTASRFVDIQHNHVNTEAQKLLANLRDERVPSILSAQNIRRSTVDWVGRDGIDGNYHAEYIQQFCTDFYNSVTKMVRQAMEKHSKQRDPMFAEVLQHLHMGNTVSSMFFGRDEQLAVAEEYLKSDSIHPLILQIAWNYDESQLNCAPTELSKLFHYFKKITALATRDRPLVLIFDSLDLLSTVDGAHELLWLPPTLPLHVKLLVSMNSGTTTIATKMQNMIENKENYLEVPSLGKDLALRVVKEWLSDSGRTLSEKQWAVVGKALDKCTLPLFVKLVCATVSRWRSYSRIQDTVLFQSVQESIHALFHRTEAQHGKLLVSHALSYITAARAGISDSEVEDLISLDDKVLDDIYQYHLPPVRRIPPLLWSRIRADLPGYLSERAADGVIVLNWYHEQFRRAAIERYFKNLNHVEQCHSAMAEYFLGVWGGIPKPYHYTEMQKQRFGVTEHEGLADRKVPKQPNVFGQQRYNTRKLNELPYHLLRAGRSDELLNLCLFNYDFMQAKASCFPLQSLISDYEDAIQRLQDPDILRQLTLVVDALRLSSSLLSRDPSMLAFELLGRLLPLVPSNPLLSKLLIRCDREAPSRNAIIPTHHCFHSPGGPLKFSLEEHMFAVFGMKLSSDNKMLISTSNKIIVWDTSTGDLARVIDPHVDGVFFGLSVSSDDKWAAAHTNNNQVILASLVTGEFVSIEPETMHNQMELQKAIFTPDCRLLIWSLEQFILYSFNGKMIQQGQRKRGQREKIIDIFYSTGSSEPWQFVLWSGDKDDWTLLLTLDVDTGSDLEIEGAVAFLDKEHRHGYTCLAYSSPMLKGQENAECPFSLVRIERTKMGYSLSYVVTSDLMDRVNQILVFPREGAGPEAKWIVATCVEVFVLHSAEPGGRVLWLKLPNNVRNIPIKPQHATTAVAFASRDSLFVAGVRKHLYLWDVNTQQLLRSLDAHFGRILNVASASLHGQNILISSSLDHTIKVWNVENIFEKSFSISMMEQAVEKIHIAKETLAAVQTRKTVGIWDLKSHRFITSLVANVHGAVVVDSLLARDGMHLVTVESDNLLLWDLRTQSVIHTLNTPGLIQIIFLCREQSHLGVLTRHVDTAEQKISRFSVYALQDLSLHHSFDYPCRQFRNSTVLKDTVTVVVTTLVKGHDSVLAVDVIQKLVKYKLRPRMPKSQKEVVVSRLVANPNNQNQIIVLESDHGGVVWDMKNRKLLRHLSEFNGEISPDGKLGLYAPVRGGLFIIDMKTGGVIRTLIDGNVSEGVNDVMANFTTNGQHVLYYHSGHKTLRVFRVIDGTLIGTFRPHANLTTWTCDPNGQTVAIGSQDGSFLSIFIHDPLQKEEAITAVAQFPSRRHLAEHLHIPVADDRAVDVFDLRNLGAVTTAVAKFKGLIGMSGGIKKSHVCSIQ